MGHAVADAISIVHWFYGVSILDLSACALRLLKAAVISLIFRGASQIRPTFGALPGIGAALGPANSPVNYGAQLDGCAGRGSSGATFGTVIIW